MDQGTTSCGRAKKTAPSVEELRSAAIFDDWRRLLINSLVLAVTIPTLLSYSGGDPVLAGWILSLFLVFYLFCCTCFFSNAATPLAKIFISLSFVALVAFFAGSLLSNVLGMVIIYLDSVLAAGLFGATLAQYRESNGTERATIVAVSNSPVHETRPKLAASFLLGILILCYGSGLSWMMINPDCDAILVATALFGGLHYLLFLHMVFVLGWLNGAFFGVQENSIAALLWYSMAGMIFICFHFLVGQLAAVTVLWLSVLASTAFNGYCLSIHASYEHIMIRIRNHRPVSLLTDLSYIPTTSATG